MDSDEEKEIAEPWLSTPINFARVRAALPKSTLIISDNDPYGAFEENKKKFAELGSKIIVLHNADHINGESHTSLPEALTELESL
jgi:predicted alpha/beta hydrolase family esterase